MEGEREKKKTRGRRKGESGGPQDDDDDDDDDVSVRAHLRTPEDFVHSCRVLQSIDRIVYIDDD